MSGPVTHKLIGFVDPSGMSLGFLVPLFVKGRSNAPLAQRLDEDRKILGFEQYGAPNATMLPAQIIEKSIGEPAVYAFAFGQGDVELAMGHDLGALARRLDDPALVDRPLLAMELADFLDLTARRCEFAARAHTAMCKASVETADHWRDLSVLTTELRRELTRHPERSTRRLAETVVARVRGRVVEIAGAGDQISAKLFESISKATNAALATLAPLYATPARAWEIRLRQRKRPKDSYRAALLLTSPRARERVTRGPWTFPPDLEVFTSDGLEFTRVVEDTSTPLFVAYDSSEPEQMRVASGDWTVREMHGIGLSARVRRPLEVDHQHWRTTHVSDSGFASGIRLAIAAELDRRAADISWHPKSSVLLRARGMLPNPDSDAWATLYDRAWAIGAAPWNSLLIPGPRRMPTLSRREPGWAANALFEEPRYLKPDLVRVVMEEMRATAAMLVDATPRSERDNERHRGAVARLLEQQGWRIASHNVRGIDSELAIEGELARIALRIEVNNGVTGGPASEEWRNVDLRGLERVVVTCAATAGAVLDGLVRTGELAVDVRDLVGFEARNATFLSLVGAQLRRLVTGFSSRSRTRLLAMIASQAFKWGHVEANSAAEFLQAIDSPDLGNTLHLEVSSTRVEEGRASAEVRLLTTDEDFISDSRRRERRRYRLVVTPDAIALYDA